MKKISLALALVVMAVLVLTGIASAGVAIATGGVEYFADEQSRFLTFNVHARAPQGPAWGQVRISFADGSKWRGKVVEVYVINSTTVLFAAKKVAGDIAGEAVYIQVQDNGSPGTKGPDRLWGNWTALTNAIFIVQRGTLLTGLGVPVLSGNLVVH